jgi:hypothetical protein
MKEVIEPRAEAHGSFYLLLIVRVEGFGGNIQNVHIRIFY